MLGDINQHLTKILALAVLLPATAVANPIVIHFSHDALWTLSVSAGRIPVWYALLIALLGLSAEYLFLRLTLRKHLEPSFPRKFATIHAFTFPATQAVAYFFGFLAEIVPILIETIYYKKRTTLIRLGPKLWVFVIVGNAISWLVGYAGLYFYLPYVT